MIGIVKIFCCFIMLCILTACSKSEDVNIKNNQADQISSANEVNIEEAKKFIDENKELLILDVRTKEEYYEGHLKGAILIPYDQIEKNIDGIKQYKNKPILVYCRTGRRSNIAVDTLKNSGFTEVYHMYDGISNWKYDVEK